MRSVELSLPFTFGRTPNLLQPPSRYSLPDRRPSSQTESKTGTTPERDYYSYPTVPPVIPFSPLWNVTKSMDVQTVR